MHDTAHEVVHVHTRTTQTLARAIIRERLLFIFAHLIEQIRFIRTSQMPLLSAYFFTLTTARRCARGCSCVHTYHSNTSRGYHSRAATIYFRASDQTNMVHKNSRINWLYMYHAQSTHCMRILTVTTPLG